MVVGDHRPLAGSALSAQTGAVVNLTKRTVEVTALLALLYGARRYYRNWGATKAESQMRLPGDSLVGDPAIQTTEAVNIDAPASAVWPWLLQMGADRDGLYGFEGLKYLAGSYDRDDDRVHPEWQHLAVGDVVRLAPEGWMGLPDGLKLGVTDIVPEKSIVLTGTRSDLGWDVLLSFHLEPHWEDRVRLLTRARVALRHPGEVFVTELARPFIALGTRGMLLGIKRRSELLLRAEVRTSAEPIQPRPSVSQVNDGLPVSETR